MLGWTGGSTSSPRADTRGAEGAAQERRGLHRGQTMVRLAHHERIRGGGGGLVVVPSGPARGEPVEPCAGALHTRWIGAVSSPSGRGLG